MARSKKASPKKASPKKASSKKASPKKGNTRKPRDWEDFEKYVAELYTQVGARDVKHNINIDGHQIDVYAVVPSADGSEVRCVVSCKHYKSTVGVEAVRQWTAVVRALSNTGRADVGVIISPHGFTQDAQAAAMASGIKLTPLERLQWAESDFKPYLLALSADISSYPIFKCDAYIPMRAKDEKSGSVLSVDQAITDFLSSDSTNLLTLLGDYGSGKTTFTRNLFRVMADKFLSQSKNARLPIYINLRDYPGHLSLPSLITDILVNRYQCRYKGHQALLRLMTEGKVLLILDAFDEMASRTDYQVTLSNFRELSKCVVDSSKVLLTCRTHYFKDRSEIDKVQEGTELYRVGKKFGNRLLYLQGFQEADIEQYVSKVCGASADEYMKRIRSTYNLMGLAQRPIMLDMITEVLPKLLSEGRSVNPAILYRKYTQAWLERDDWRVQLGAEQRLNFTLALAEEMYGQVKTALPWKDIERAIARRWPTSSAKEREWYAYDIRACTFVTWDAKAEHFRFVHESFMEYFVASSVYASLLSQPPASAYTARMHTPQVLDFLLAHPQTTEFASCVDALIPARDNSAIRTAEYSLDRNIHLGNALNLLSAWRNLVSNRLLLNATLSELRFRATELKGNELTNVTIRNGEFRNNTENASVYSHVQFEFLSILDHSAIECICSHAKIHGNVVERSVFVKASYTNVLWDLCRSYSVKYQGVYGTKLTGTDNRIVDSAIEHSTGLDVSLFRFEMENVKASDCIFERLKLRNCLADRLSVSNTVFRNCSFDDVRFASFDVLNSSLIDCTFSSVEFVEGVCENVAFTTAAFRNGVKFSASFIAGCRFIKCVFTEADAAFASIDGDAWKAFRSAAQPLFIGCTGLSARLSKRLASLGWQFQSASAATN